MAKSNVALAAYKAGERSSRGKNRVHHKAQMTVPLAVVGGFMPLLDFMAGSFAAGPGSPEGLVRHMARDLCMITTGYDTWNKKWNMSHMWRGTFPILLGLGVHKLATKFGLNRALGRAGIPFLRI